jgi:CHAD domain-containing protein
MVGDRVRGKESVRLMLPGDLGPECLREEWDVDIHPQESQVLAFWDTFEWGLWFGGHILYSSGGAYCLCAREGGWLGAVLCEERAGTGQRFWSDFETGAMRARLEGLLGLRGLAPVAEGTFRLRRCDVRNGAGKIVCRLEWSSVFAGKRRDEDLLHSCRVLPLFGYEAEAARLVEHLVRRGARTSGDGPVEALLRHVGHVPRKYTLRPVFGLEMDTPAREAVGRIVRAILEIAESNVPGLVNDLDTEFLHDYRICLRKVRSVLSLVKDVYPAEETRRMRKILGDLARQTNRLRDLDVYLLAREEYLGSLPPVLHPALDGMFKDFSAEREREARRVTAKLRATTTRRLLREVEECFSPEAAHEPSPAAGLPVGALVFRRIYKRYLKIRGIAAGIGAETPDEAVHRLRIECKKLRYLMEFFAELFPREEGAGMLRLLRRLQNRLGEFNDALVQQRSLMNYWEQKRPGSKIALGVGGLVAVLYRRQQQARGLIDEALEGFCGSSTAAAFKHAFKLVSAPATEIKRSARK